MVLDQNSWQKIEQTLQQMIEDQKALLLSVGRRSVPNLTPEDMLQPNDYLELEHNPHFRYEEGTLAGMQSIQMALQALKKATRR